MIRYIFLKRRTDSEQEIRWILECIGHSDIHRAVHCGGEHLRRGKLAQEETRGGTLEWKTADGRSSSRTRRQHEQAKIARHDPPLNRSVGGEGRIAARKKK